MNDAKVAEKFKVFHEENPAVYRELVKISRELKARGREHYGMRALFEVIRFHRAMNTTDPDYKLNNNYTPHYARLIMDQEPDLAGFFDLRSMKEDPTAYDWNNIIEDAACLI